MSGRDPVEGLASFGIPEEITFDMTTQEEINQFVFYIIIHPNSPLFFYRLDSYADDMENYHEAFYPLYIEHLDIATSNLLTEKNTDHLEASGSNLSFSQDSYMVDINQGNILLYSHIELDNPKTQCPKSNPQHDLPYSTTTTSIPVPTCSYSPMNSPPVQFQATHSSIRFFILLIP